MTAVFNPLRRYFNQLIDHGSYFEKVSIKTDKLEEEFNFLITVPSHLQKYYPKVFDFKKTEDTASYKIDKIPVFDASLLFIREQKITPQVADVIMMVSEYLRAVPYLEVSREAYHSSFFKSIYEKNLSRIRDIFQLSEYSELNKICKEFGYMGIEDYCYHLNRSLHADFQRISNYKLYYSHGDLCFSNILITGDQLFLIDPRGYKDHLNETFRTIYYDIAKMSQCIFGNYDLINHGLFTLEGTNLKFAYDLNISNEVHSAFGDLISYFDIDFKLIRKLEASLFLSLIPYHQESSTKMKAFLVNSISIFKTHE